MFMQIMQGKITDPTAVRTTMDRWYAELQPGAKGWLGGTYGVTDDNQLIGCIRFESREAAEANSGRAEQGMWWKEMEQLFDGPVTFHDCSDVMPFLNGGSDDAGFVQVIQARVKDRDRLMSLMEQSSTLLSTYRPDVIGGTIAIDDNGFVTETVAFVSEAAAREAEKEALPTEVTKVLAEEMDLLDDVRYLDLHQPWFASAKRTT